MVKSKNESVLDLLISQRDENEYAKVESRMGIAVKIAKALKRKGMTQKELAEKLGKRPSEISKWLTGNHNFTHDTLFDIQTVLNIRLLDYEMENINEIVEIKPIEIKYKDNMNVTVCANMRIEIDKQIPYKHSKNNNRFYLS